MPENSYQQFTRNIHCFELPFWDRVLIPSVSDLYKRSSEKLLSVSFSTTPTQLLSTSSLLLFLIKTHPKTNPFSKTHSAPSNLTNQISTLQTHFKMCTEITTPYMCGHMGSRTRGRTCDNPDSESCTTTYETDLIEWACPACDKDSNSEAVCGADGK